MTISARYLTGCAALALAAVVVAPPPALAIDPARLQAAEQTPNDWLTYHGGYKSQHYSGLDQINANNVKNLEVAWTHLPGRSTRGLQSMPLAADGVLYYSGSYSRVYALDGATGKLIWSYFPQLDDELVAMQTHSPYNRGVALGDNKVFVGTVDGRLIALDMKTGKPVWDTRLVDSKKLTVGFTGAPLVVKDTVIIGSQGGEWTSRGPLFGVDAKTGQKKWEFLTVAGTEDAKATWGNESWRTGGGGAWMPGGYDPETNTIWWGTANPAPLYDWSGADWQKSGARPGTNLYTTSVIALDPDTGKLKFYHQELPHDAWDFDLAVGEFLMVDRDGRKLVVHPNKGGFRLRLRSRQREGAERLADRKKYQLREGYRPEDRRADRPTRSVARSCELATLPGDCRRRQLERGRLQPEDRPVVQDRAGMVHGRGRGKDHANHRADGAAQYRSEFQARPAAGRTGAWTS